MVTKVAIVDKNSFAEAVSLIGGIKHLNSSQNRVVVKVGIYNTASKICTTVNTLKSMIDAFTSVNDFLIVESDSGAGPGLERLEIWRDCFTDNIKPFNLSHNQETKEVNVAGEMVNLSHVLFKPNVFISSHVPRRYENTGDEDLMNEGSIIKNLLGLIPDTKKFRFHKCLPNALLDMYEAIGGIDLAVLDGTRVYLGREKERTTAAPEILIVGEDAFAVEAVGMHLVGFNPTEMSVLQEARKRGLGEIDIKNIDIIGDIETPKKEVLQAFRKIGFKE
ncbi:MAG: DUF362 domain-containing protein [Asgard group archaeon]|nr:DUF362 domain-containing protein [Asgard group archaeon]